jgi:hypothetical protein
MSKYNPLKLDVPVVAAQGTAFVAGSKGVKGKKGNKKYLPKDEWNALRADEIVKMHPHGSHVCHPEQMGESDYIQTGPLKDTH